jgi:hypothetical protein
LPRFAVLLFLRSLVLVSLVNLLIQVSIILNVAHPATQQIIVVITAAIGGIVKLEQTHISDPTIISNINVIIVQIISLLIVLLFFSPSSFKSV